MGSFFGFIYNLCVSFFGSDLNEYLLGELSPDSQANQYSRIGLVTCAIALVVALVYYVILDHPRFSSWLGWLCFAMGNSVVSAFVAFFWIKKDYDNGLMYSVDQATQAKTDLAINMSNIAFFSLANFFVAFFFFFIFSVGLMWVSKNCYQSPFHK